jgi:hypothetical protein
MTHPTKARWRRKTQYELTKEFINSLVAYKLMAIGKQLLNSETKPRGRKKK